MSGGARLRRTGARRLIGDDDHGDEAPARRLSAAARPGPDGAAPVRHGAGPAVHAGLAGAARRLARVREAAGGRRRRPAGRGRAAGSPRGRPTRSRRSSCSSRRIARCRRARCAAKVRERLPVERQTAAWRSFGHAPEPLPRVVYNLSTVAATLHFEDLVRVVLPMTEWWHRLTGGLDARRHRRTRPRSAGSRRRSRTPSTRRCGRAPEAVKRRLRVRSDLLWMIRVVGALTIVRSGRRLPRAFTTTAEGVAAATEADWLPLVAGRGRAGARASRRSRARWCTR